MTLTNYKLLFSYFSPCLHHIGDNRLHADVKRIADPRFHSPSRGNTGSDHRPTISYYTETSGTVYEPSSTGEGATTNLKKSVQGVQYISCPDGSVVTGSFSLFDVGKKFSSSWTDCSSAIKDASPAYQTYPTSPYCGISTSPANKCTQSFVQIFNYNVGGNLGGELPYELYLLTFVDTIVPPTPYHSHILLPLYGSA